MLARRLHAEEEQAERLRRSGGGLSARSGGHILGTGDSSARARSSERVDVSSRGGSGTSWGGSGQSRSAAAAARALNAPFVPSYRRDHSGGGGDSARAGRSERSGSGRRVSGGGQSREESDLEMAQRLEREELLRLQDEERSNSRHESEQRRQFEVYSALQHARRLHRSDDSRRSGEGNNSFSGAPDAAGGGSRSRLTRSGRAFNSDEDEDYVPEYDSPLAAAEAERVAPQQRRDREDAERLQRQFGGGGRRGGRGQEYDSVLAHLQAQLGAGVGGFREFAAMIGASMGMGGGRGRAGDAVDIDGMSSVRGKVEE
jgi:hypothetical protein